MTKMNLDNFTNDEIIHLYPQIIRILKERKVIHSKNLIGDLGEYLAISYYCNTKGLPNLQRAPTSTKNIDAISRDGERYSIKSASTTSTGTFWGLNPPNSEEQDVQKFEYVIIVIFDENYMLTKIIEIDWNQFLKLKRWHSRMNAWNLPVNSKLEAVGKTVYSI
jgi:hypothetical protein